MHPSYWQCSLVAKLLLTKTETELCHLQPAIRLSLRVFPDWLLKCDVNGRYGLPSDLITGWY